MKKIRLSMIGALSAITFFTACQRSGQDVVSNRQTANNTIATADQGTASTGRQRPHNGTACNPYAYTVLLESVTQVGANYEWVWSVQNSNPGNGGNGTVQDLSHWGMQFGTCVDFATVVGAAYSSNGTSWNNFTPSLQADPSQGCMTLPVLKFDFGTSGANKSYYKVVVSADYDVEMVPAYYKSGSATGCCTFQFQGMGCGLSTETPK